MKTFSLIIGLFLSGNTWANDNNWTYLGNSAEENINLYVDKNHEHKLINGQMAIGVNVMTMPVENPNDMMKFQYFVIKKDCEKETGTSYLYISEEKGNEPIDVWKRGTLKSNDVLAEFICYQSQH